MPNPVSNLFVAPIMVIVEAKRENMNDCLGQCIAAMAGVQQRFNFKKNKPIDPIFGCITTGSLWKFLRLQGGTVSFNLNKYTISQPDIIPGHPDEHCRPASRRGDFHLRARICGGNDSHSLQQSETYVAGDELTGKVRNYLN